MPAPRDLTGQIFGRLTALRVAGPSEKSRSTRSWWCQCECGAHVAVASQELLRGESKSCGCLKRERDQTFGHANAVHGHARDLQESSEYRSWVEMRRRCTNPNSIGFKYYGGRGISVCSRWDEYANFLADMGPKPSPKHSIDRYPNKDGNYEPGNCRWATPTEQARNRKLRR